MRVERDQPFGLELAQRFAHRNPAHPELDADRILAQRLPLGVDPAKNALADRVRGHARERLTAKREQHEIDRPAIRRDALLSRLCFRPAPRTASTPLSATRHGSTPCVTA